MKEKKRALVVVSVLIILMICVAFTVRTFQNDTFYTIKVGESIVKNGLDMKDHFSIHSLNYTYPHWLYDIIVYRIYQWGGFQGLYQSAILIFMGIGIIFYFANLKRNKSYFVSLLFSILAMIMLARFVAVRAQLVTYLLFLIEIILIEKLLSDGKKWAMIGLFLLNILIANLHAAVWPFYFILMLPYLVEYFLSWGISKIKKPPRFGVFVRRIELVSSENIKYLIIVFLLGLFLGLLTPIGDVPYTYFVKILQGDTMKYINEHKPLVLIENFFVIGYLLILLIPLIFTKVRIRLSDFLMIGGLLFMSFLSVRHVALLAVIGMFYLCRLICNIGFIHGDHALDFDLPWYSLFVVFVTIMVTSAIVYNINYKEEFIDTNTYPVAMADYIKKNFDVGTIRLYNEYDFGSYLIYQDIPVFVDSRSDLYTKPFNHKDDIFDESMKITEKYGRIFQKYEITHILTYKDTDLNQILAASSNYELLHKEGRFMLYQYLAQGEKTE